MKFKTLRGWINSVRKLKQVRKKKKKMSSLLPRLISASVCQLKQGRSSPKVALQTCYEILQLSSPSSSGFTCPSFVSTTPTAAPTTSSSFASSVRDFTNSFSTLIVPVLTPDQVCNLLSVSVSCCCTAAAAATTSAEHDTSLTGYFWWQQASGGCEHSQLLSALLKRASVFRSVLTTTQLVRCVRVAVNRFGPGSDDLLLTFYGQLVDELISRLESSATFSSSLIPFSSSDNNNNNSNNTDTKDATITSTVVTKNAFHSEVVVVEIVSLLSEIKLNYSYHSHYSKKKSKVCDLESSILIFLDEVVVPGLQHHYCSSTSAATSSLPVLVNLLKQYFSDDVGYHDELVKALKIQVSQLSRSAELPPSSAPATARETLVVLLRHVEDYLSSPTLASNKDDGGDNDKNGGDREQNAQQQLRRNFVSAVTSAPLRSKLDALVISRSLVALATWQRRHWRLQNQERNLPSALGLFSGDEKRLLSSVLLERHGYLMERIQSFFRDDDDGSPYRSELEKDLIEKALPKAISVLMS